MIERIIRRKALKMLTGLPLGGLMIGSELTINQNINLEGKSDVESVKNTKRIVKAYMNHSE